MTVAAPTLGPIGDGSVSKAQERDEFEGWARLAASIDQYTKRAEPAKTVNGRVNGHGQNGAVQIERLPNFLLRGPVIDDEVEPDGKQQFTKKARIPVAKPYNGSVWTAPAPQANDEAESVDKQGLDKKARKTDVKPRNGSARPAPAPQTHAEPLPFILTEALADDLSIPEPPANSLMAKGPAAINGWTRTNEPMRKPRLEVARPASASPEKVKLAIVDMDGYVPDVRPSRRSGTSLSSTLRRRLLSRRLRRRLRRAAAVGAVGVSVGGAAMALLYIAIFTVSSGF